MDVDVAALHRSYLVMLKRRGGVLQRSARVRRVSAARGAWTIDAGDVQVSCGRIVNAAGAWVDEVAAAAGVPGLGIQAKRRTVSVSPHSYNGRSEHWPIVIDGLERWYFKPEGPHVLLSPADETDVPPGDARPDALAIAMALDAVREVTSLQLRSVTRSWAGLRSFVPDRSPVIGGWAAYPGFDFLAGQGGYGIQMGPALAVLAADLVLHQRPTTWSAAFGVDPQQLAPARLSAER
jgi:D-arginine dehydrogenase